MLNTLNTPTQQLLVTCIKMATEKPWGAGSHSRDDATGHNSVRDSLITLQWVGPGKILIDSEIYFRKLVNYRAHVSAEQ